MAPLVGIAPDFGALAAAHVAFEFMDRRCLRSPHDVEGNGLMRVAAKAFHFEIAKPGVDRVAQRRSMAAPVPESRACACSTPRRRAGRLPCVLPSPALPLPAPMRRKWSRVTWCPCERGCAGPRWTGKPLQIAVDGVTGTTEATQHSRHRLQPRYWRRRRGPGGTSTSRFLPASSTSSVTVTPRRWCSRRLRAACCRRHT